MFNAILAGYITAQRGRREKREEEGVRKREALAHAQRGGERETTTQCRADTHLQGHRRQAVGR